MPQIQEQWDPILLLPQIYHHFDLGAKNVPVMRDQLFNIQGSTLFEERGAGIGSMGNEAWDGFKNTGQVGELDFDAGYEKAYVHQEYPVNFKIRIKLILNDQYGQMNKNNSRLGASAQRKMEIDAASILNNAFTDSAAFHGGDDKPLCSASHPDSPARSGNTQNNTGTSPLTEAAVSATRVSMKAFKDDKNDITGVEPNELWVPTNLEDKAIKIVGSALLPGTANNDTNPQNLAGRWRVIPWARLDATKAWFMVDGTMRHDLVNWYNREVFRIIVKSEDLVWLQLQAKLHYSFGWDDWRWIFGHNPS